MRILVVGSGGREHALVWKLKQSPDVTEVFCAPGNGGISQIAACVPIKATDINALVQFATNEKIDFTVVGMEDSLVLGIVDEFQKHGLKIFGPDKRAARIESSKVYSKWLMGKYGIPTAQYGAFDDYGAALEYVEKCKHPCVIKADGLAVGKGVLICQNIQESKSALELIMLEKKFGASGNQVVIEEFLTGNEVSVLSFCDGETVVPMVSAQDHKRVFDNDLGLNTGGMGAFSPSRFYTEGIEKICMEEIFLPTVNALKQEGSPFKGVIYFGLMLTADGPKVIEYNCRFGDPETQVVLPRLKSDLLHILLACADGKLAGHNIEWEDNAVACVMLTSGGYPEKYEVGYEISGLDSVHGVCVFHSGTRVDGGKFFTAGGRTLGVAAKGDNLEEAVAKVYSRVPQISFKDIHYRKDIGL